MAENRTFLFCVDTTLEDVPWRTKRTTRRRLTRDRWPPVPAWSGCAARFSELRFARTVFDQLSSPSHEVTEARACFPGASQSPPPDIPRLNYPELALTRGLIDRTRARLNVKRLKTIFGVKGRPPRDRKDQAPRLEVVVETPKYDRTIFKLHFGTLTLKA